MEFWTKLILIEKKNAIDQYICELQSYGKKEEKIKLKLASFKI